MAKGRGTVLSLPDGSPERLDGGYKNELLRYGDVDLRLTRAPIESVEWEHRLLESIVEIARFLADPPLRVGVVHGDVYRAASSG
jgi:hypothetical protein